MGRPGDRGSCGARSRRHDASRGLSGSSGWPTGDPSPQAEHVRLMSLRSRSKSTWRSGQAGGISSGRGSSPRARGSTGPSRRRVTTLGASGSGRRASGRRSLAVSAEFVAASGPATFRLHPSTRTKKKVGGTMATGSGPTSCLRASEPTGPSAMHAPSPVAWGSREARSGPPTLGES